MTGRGRRLPYLLTAFAMLFAFAVAVPARASSTQESLLMDDNLLLNRGPAVSDQTLSELKGMGVDRVRFDVHWADVAPNSRPSDPGDPARYPAGAFDKFDHLVRQARAVGMNLLLTVTGPAPPYGHPAGTSPVTMPAPNEYSRFVEMLGRRYSGAYADENQGGAVLPRVTFWSLWNEPNWHSSLMPQYKQDRHGVMRPYAPRMYRRLFRAGTAGLARAGHGGDTVLLGETAPSGSGARHSQSPLKPGVFLRELFCLYSNGRPLLGRSARRRGCSDYEKAGPLAASGYAHHPYPIMNAPQTASPDRDVIALADAGRLERLLDAATAARRLPATLNIWYTEFGWQTSPPDPYRGVPLDRQAAWIGEAERMAWADPRVAGHGQFLLRDDDPRDNYPASDRRHWLTWQSGLEFADGTHKPAYDAYRLPFAAPAKIRTDQPLDLWGMVRAAPDGSDPHVDVEYRGADSDTWSRVYEVEVTDPHNVFSAQLTAPRPGEYRFVWTPPASTQSSLLAPRAAPAPLASALVRVVVG